MAAMYFHRNPATNPTYYQDCQYVNAVPKSGCFKTKAVGINTNPASFNISRNSNSSVFSSVR